jgi:4-amino-4-deoxy-L-arabinose transferase-like glycosyltransferase
VLGFTALMLGALLPTLVHKRRILINQIVGVGGLIVGAAGVYFHGRAIWDEIDGEDIAIKVIGKIMKDAPPLFAPAAFAGIGLLLLTLHRLTKEHTHEHPVHGSA